MSEEAEAVLPCVGSVLTVSETLKPTFCGTQNPSLLGAGGLCSQITPSSRMEEKRQVATPPSSGALGLCDILSVNLLYWAAARQANGILRASSAIRKLMRKDSKAWVLKLRRRGCWRCTPGKDCRLQHSLGFAGYANRAGAWRMDATASAELLSAAALAPTGPWLFLRWRRRSSFSNLQTTTGHLLIPASAPCQKKQWSFPETVANSSRGTGLGLGLAAVAPVLLVWEMGTAGWAGSGVAAGPSPERAQRRTRW